MRRVRCLAALLAMALAGGCATRATVVLLPEADGKATAVTVRQGDSQVVLDKPYAAADVKAQGVSAFESNPQDVQARFGPALAAQPARADTFVLYFVENKDEFTEESKQLVGKVIAEVAKRPVPDVLVVGHTDAVGNDQVNDALGLRRAETVRAGLIAAGVPADDVKAISRGKRALAVPTPDGVAEPRNRRVEIIVR
ncbi:MAG TPA: OmpA family protein [Casimicrobiaceae bacterium]|nr:OmpA family protein [Casimicrobiaceae bacterium]